MDRKPTRHLSTHAQETVAVVLQVRGGVLQVLLWRRGMAPFAGRWALPGGRLEPGETLEGSIRRHLAAKVDVRELSHLEQLETRADPGGWKRRGQSRRRPAEDRVASGDPASGRVTTAYLGLVRTGLDPVVPADTSWHPVERMPRTAFDHGEIAIAGQERLRAKLSYTNLGFALAPETFTISELRDLYAAALGHEVSSTNLQRVLLRRGVLVPTGERRASGRAGGRPAEVYRFRSSDLEITDQFAVLRPPARIARR